MADESLKHNLGGSLGFHTLTLTQLAASLARPAIATKGLAPISRLGLEAIAARVAHEALKSRELKYFEPVATLPGFARRLGKTIGELRMARVSPEVLSQKNDAAQDLAKLLLRYEDELAQRSVVDLAQVFALATQAAENRCGRFIGLPVLLLDVPLETRAHREMFQAIARKSSAVLVALSGPDETDAPATTLEHLRRYLFATAPPRVSNLIKATHSNQKFDIFSAPGEGLETVEIARRILRFARDGVGFDQIAILLRSPERYQPMVEDALRRARIPAWFGRGVARPDPAGRAFLALLACAAERCSASRFAEYLSFGQVPDQKKAGHEWVGPQDDLLSASKEPSSSTEVAEDSATPAAPAAWEKLLVDAAVIGGRSRWVRRLSGLEREFELKLNTAKDDEPQYHYLATALERLRSLSAFALPLIERLDLMPKAAVWSEWLEHLIALARGSLRDPDGVLAVLAEFEPMGDVGPVVVDEVAEVLSDRLRFLRPEPPQRRWGRVFVGAIDEVRGCEFPIVFLPGLAEGLFPQRAFEDALLLDEVRRELSSDLPLRHDRGNEERERLHLVVACARDRFIASYPRMDVAEARPRVPSFYALELPRALEGGLPKLKDFEERARDAAPARLNWPAPSNTEDAIDDAEFDLASLGKKKHARYLVEANLHLGRSLRARYARWRSSWKEADGFIVQNPAALDALSTHRLMARPWSPSSLEQYAVCPYKFALYGIYRLRPREEAGPLQQLDPLTRGGLFHEVQRRLLQELKQKSLLPVDAERLPEALDLCNDVLNHVAAEYKELLAPAIERVWNSEIEDLRTDLRGWLQQVAQNDTDWEPLYFEFSFGLQDREGHDPASVSKEIALAEGVCLRGSIDLVERHMTKATLRVTDHKSGKALDRIPVCVGAGKSLQPLLYGLAARLALDTEVEYGRLFYATQRGGYRHMAVPVNERASRVLASLLERIDAAISSGFLPPFPEKDACDYCDYRLVCGPYEGLRSGRHKNREDPRLDGLIDIRGMG